MTRERGHKERLTFNISRARVFYVPIILPPSRELILLPIIARKGSSLKNLSIAAAAAKETRASSSFHARQNANGRGMKLLFHASQPQSDAIYSSADCKSCLPSCAAYIKLHVQQRVTKYNNCDVRQLRITRDRCILNLETPFQNLGPIFFLSYCNRLFHLRYQRRLEKRTRVISLWVRA
jgi:hypothetical protein